MTPNQALRALAIGLALASAACKPSGGQASNEAQQASTSSNEAQQASTSSNEAGWSDQGTASTATSTDTTSDSSEYSPSGEPNGTVKNGKLYSTIDGKARCWYIAGTDGGWALSCVALSQLQ